MKSIEESYLNVLRAAIVLMLTLVLLFTLAAVGYGISQWRTQPQAAAALVDSPTLAAYKQQSLPAPTPASTPPSNMAQPASKPAPLASAPQAKPIWRMPEVMAMHQLMGNALHAIDPDKKLAIESVSGALKAAVKEVGPEHEERFLAAYVVFMRGVLDDIDLINHAAASEQDERGMAYINQAHRYFVDGFVKQLAEEKQAQQAWAVRMSKRQEAATMALYVAGGGFLAFLLIALVLVMVKIERNLRAGLNRDCSLGRGSVPS